MAFTDADPKAQPFQVKVDPSVGANEAQEKVTNSGHPVTSMAPTETNPGAENEVNDEQPPIISAPPMLTRLGNAAVTRAVLPIPFKSPPQVANTGKLMLVRLGQVPNVGPFNKQSINEGNEKLDTAISSRRRLPPWTSAGNDTLDRLWLSVMEMPLLIVVRAGNETDKRAVGDTGPWMPRLSIVVKLGTKNEDRARLKLPTTTDITVNPVRSIVAMLLLEKRRVVSAVQVLTSNVVSELVLQFK
jgi:hypothetical protein